MVAAILAAKEWKQGNTEVTPARTRSEGIKPNEIHRRQLC